LLQGYYTQSGSTAFQHFIIEATDATISYYADDFSIGGQAPASSSSSSSRASSSAPAAKKFIGNITTSGAVRSDFTRYWNQITPENEGKWGSVEGTRDVYNWAPVDRIYAYARANNIPVKAHTFVWGAQSPSWINNLSAADTAAEIEEWIRDYCARYPDTAMIDVVNEAVVGHQPAAYAQKAFGNNWIQRVFQLARQYCPNSILILNDYNNIRWQHNEFIALAKAQGNYIDAVGLQAHELKGLTAAQVKTAIDNIWNQVGKPIYISEYDIGDTNDQVQLQNFQAHFPVFWDHPHVKGITIWGYVNGRTWIEGSGLIQDNGTPRPAMTWLLNNYINKQ
jgi:GH35 family endo-1,4-beta-xylanase